MDNGPHACDLIRRLLGEVVLAQGMVRQDLHLPAGCESEAFGLFRNHDNTYRRAPCELGLPPGRLPDPRNPGERRPPQGRDRPLAADRPPSPTAARLDRRYLPDRVAERDPPGAGSAARRSHVRRARNLRRADERPPAPPGRDRLGRLPGHGDDPGRSTSPTGPATRSTSSRSLVHLPSDRPPPRDPGAAAMKDRPACRSSPTTPSTRLGGRHRDRPGPVRRHPATGSVDAGPSRPIDLGEWVAAGRPDLRREAVRALPSTTASPRSSDVADRLDPRRRSPPPCSSSPTEIGLDNAWPGQPGGIPRARLLDRSEMAGPSPALGFRFGSHGRSHARLDRLGRIGLDRRAGRRSRDEIEQVVGRLCPLLSYAYGASNARVRRDRRRERMTRRSGRDSIYGRSANDDRIRHRPDRRVSTSEVGRGPCRVSSPRVAGRARAGRPPGVAVRPASVDA